MRGAGTAYFFGITHWAPLAAGAVQQLVHSSFLVHEQEARAMMEAARNRCLIMV